MLDTTNGMLSVLIVNWNTRDLLLACLRSIEAFPPSSAYEVIVIDNASRDESASAVATQFPWVKLVASPVNTGYAAGNNLAFREAKGDFLLTLNPDTEFQDQSLDIALAFMEAHPTVGCLGIRQIGLDGNTQKSVRGFPTVTGIVGDLLKIRSGRFDSYRLARFDYDVEQMAPQPMGTFLMFRAIALDPIGDRKRPFDEGFPIFFNEVDLLYRLNKAGWPCWYTPSARILHHGGESTRQVRKSMIWESHRSLMRYLHKHAGTPLSRIGLLFVAAVVYTAALVRAKGYDAGFRA